jgi:HAD superfamily hydrolase (TIGR01459 family)
MIDLPDDARLLICDVWGVVHDGVRAFPGALAALARWRGEGRTVVLVTNAPRPSVAIRRQLGALGVDGRHYDAIVSSGDAGVALVARSGAAEVGFIGTAVDRAALEEADVRIAAGGGEALVVCTGLDARRPAVDDYADELALMLGRGAEMLCLNPDIVACPGDRLELCAGAIAQRYEAMGGAVTYTGKPHRPIYDAALVVGEAAAGRRFATVDVLAIGDAVPTDLVGAARMGFRFLFVTSGIERDAIAEHGVDSLLTQAHDRYGLTGFAPHRVVDALA